MERLLVTGGLGFVGNETVRQAKIRADVAIVDNRNRVAPHIEDLAEVPLFEADILDQKALDQAFQDFKPDTVLHLAAIHFIPECNADPARTLRVNVEGTQNILDAAARHQVKHTLVTSSGAVYADSPNALAESHPVAPVDIYGWSKLHSENLAQLYADQTKAPVTSVRLFNVVGPRETNAHILPEIVQQLRSSDTLRLGNITTQRDFINVHDAAEGFLRLATSPPLDPTHNHQIVNLATGAACSIADLIELIAQALGRPLAYQKDPARFRPADKQIQVADVNRLESLTGWRPPTSLAAGVQRLLEFEGLLPTPAR